MKTLFEISFLFLSKLRGGTKDRATGQLPPARCAYARWTGLGARRPSPLSAVLANESRRQSLQVLPSSLSQSSHRDDDDSSSSNPRSWPPPQNSCAQPPLPLHGATVLSPGLVCANFIYSPTRPAGYLVVDSSRTVIHPPIPCASTFLCS